MQERFRTDSYARTPHPCHAAFALHATATSPPLSSIWVWVGMYATMTSQLCCYACSKSSCDATGDVFEIGKRFPHEIEVASSEDGVNPAEYVYVASVDSKDAGVAPGIGALVRYKAV